MLGAWWAFLAPTNLGGRAAYVLVHGHSMEPMLYTGDLVYGLRQSSYEVGDLVVYRVQGGSVIHRIVEGSNEAGWITQGDNNSWHDPWVVPNSDISGKYVATLPDFAQYLTWVQRNPLLFGGAIAAVVLLSYLPIVPRRLAPELKAALADAEREPRPEGRSNGDLSVLLLSALGVLATGAVVVQAALSGNWTILATVCAVACAASLGFSLWLARGFFTGRDKAEPAASLRTLEGRLYRVADFPELPEPPTPAKNATVLRKIAERYRLPVLHHVDPETGEHAFLLLSVQEGDFLWAPVCDPPDDGDDAAKTPVLAGAPARSGASSPTSPATAERASLVSPDSPTARAWGRLRVSALPRPVFAALTALMTFVLSSGAASQVPVVAVGDPRVGSAAATVCDLGAIQVLPTIDHATVIGIAVTTSRDADAPRNNCAGQTVFVRVGWIDSGIPPEEPPTSGYWYGSLDASGLRAGVHQLTLGPTGTLFTSPAGDTHAEAPSLATVTPGDARTIVATAESGGFGA